LSGGDARPAFKCRSTSAELVGLSDGRVDPWNDVDDSRMPRQWRPARPHTRRCVVAGISQVGGIPCLLKRNLEDPNATKTIPCFKQPSQASQAVPSRPIKHYLVLVSRRR
ncbi:hypothetical protein CI238_01356, partial [Colletotrichum incanum]